MHVDYMTIKNTAIKRTSGHTTAIHIAKNKNKNKTY